MKADFTPAELLKQIVKIYQPERVGLLTSENQARLLKQAFASESLLGLKLESQSLFQNGGLRVAFSVLSL